MVSIRNGKATGHLLAILVWKEGLHGLSAFDSWHCRRRKVVSWQWGSYWHSCYQLMDNLKANETRAAPSGPFLQRKCLREKGQVNPL